MEKYEQIGECLVSKAPSEEYRENYDKVFGKKLYYYEKKLIEQGVCPKCDKHFLEKNFVCDRWDCSIFPKLVG